MVGPEEGETSVNRRAELEDMYVGMRGYFLRIAARLGRFEDAEDLVQTAFMQGFRHLHRFRSESSLKTWMCAIMRNTCLEAKRRRTEEQVDELPDTPVYSGMDDSIYVAQLIGSLTPEQRRVIRLYYFKPLNFKQIGALRGQCKTRPWRDHESAIETMRQVA